MNACFQHCLLVARGCTRLGGANETSANPHSGGAQRQGHGQAATIGNTASGNHLDGFASEGRKLAFAEINDSRNEDRGSDLSGVTASLPSLRTDDIDSSIKAFLDVFGTANHIHDGDASRVQAVDSVFGGDTHSADEKSSLLLNDDVNQLGQLSSCVIVVCFPGASTNLR
eukprot:Lithocolla_globosa_v1_NODE_6194_length_1123_cov_7.620787.p2 type:complete len:170 gc:universal NODE_6194_length_1123_cov_7.620787:330-839(+)